jgi:YD repeat-containing protein
LDQLRTYAYDAAGNRTLAAAPAGAYTIAYDALDRSANVAGPFGAA